MKLENITFRCGHVGNYAPRYWCSYNEAMDRVKSMSCNDCIKKESEQRIIKENKSEAIAKAYCEKMGIPSDASYDGQSDGNVRVTFWIDTNKIA